jgi:hypothetical protein
MSPFVIAFFYYSRLVLVRSLEGSFYSHFFAQYRMRGSCPHTIIITSHAVRSREMCIRQIESNHLEASNEARKVDLSSPQKVALFLSEKSIISPSIQCRLARVPPSCI